MSFRERGEAMYSALVNQVNFSSSILDPNRFKNHIPLSIPFIGVVCQVFFLSFWGCSEKRLRNYLDIIASTQSLLLPAHGLIGNQNARMKPELLDSVRLYLRKLASERGESIATRKYTRKTFNNEARITVSYENENITYLPSYNSYQKLFDTFKKEFPDIDISLRSFEEFWKNDFEFKNLKIRSPAKDVCDECAIYRNKICSMSDADYSTFNEEIISEQNLHIQCYRAMRDEYERDIRKAKDVSDSDRPIVLSFDYAQNLEIPHDPLQPQKFYFTSRLKAYQFGVVNEELDIHTHYIYSEYVSGKGADEVASMLLHYIKNELKRNSRHLILWADNCPGQNKNSTLYQLLAWLMEGGLYDVVELKFQVKGHTRNSVDRGFGITKRFYFKAPVWSMECLKRVLETSVDERRSLKIKAIIIDQTGVFLNFTDYFLKYLYIKIKGINDYHGLKASKNLLGKLICFKAEDPSTTYSQPVLLKERIPCVLAPKPLKGINVEKVTTFYKELRKFIPDPFKDILCPKPDDSYLKQVIDIKNQRKQHKSEKKNLMNENWESHVGEEVAIKRPKYESSDISESSKNSEEWVCTKCDVRFKLKNDGGMSKPIEKHIKSHQV
jgi:hypothetical protein